MFSPNCPEHQSVGLPLLILDDTPSIKPRNATEEILLETDSLLKKYVK